MKEALFYFGYGSNPFKKGGPGIAIALRSWWSSEQNYYDVTRDTREICQCRRVIAWLARRPFFRGDFDPFWPSVNFISFLAPDNTHS